MIKEYEHDITPETRVNTLLKAYPQLENVLIDMSPALKKLRNPVLRKTVAKMATLRQVAQIGNIPLAVLINELRAAAGFAGDVYKVREEQSDDVLPVWFDPAKIKKSLDARPILESGKQPLNQVFSDLKDFEPKHIYELITPFLPAPLMDQLKSKGYSAWSKQEQPDFFKTYITKE